MNYQAFSKNNFIIKFQEVIFKVIDSNVILDCSSILKTFEATVAVNNLSFKMNKGDILGLVGENGAGKSTLLKIISGEYSPDSGKIFYQGKEVHWKNSFQALEKGIGHVHQHPLFIADFTVEENLFLGKEYTKYNNFIDNQAITKKASEIMKKYPIYPDLNLKKRVGELSAGEKEVVEILKILSYEPEILILDEPTASLPKNECTQLFNMIKQLNQAYDLTVLFISHKLEEAIDLCNKIMVMRNGKNVGVFSRNEFDREFIIKKMINQDITKFYPDKTQKTGQVIIKVDNLSASQVRNINFFVKAGEIVGFYGLIGAGMEEVVKSIFGITEISAGEVMIGGKKIAGKYSVSQMVAEGVYLIPGDRHKYGLFPSFNIKENTTIAHLKKMFSEVLVNNKREKLLVEQQLTKLKVKYSYLEQGIDELSGGNQQKIIVSRWLMSPCNLLIVDDPTVGIDIGAKKDIYQLLRNLTTEGNGVILISSEINEIIGMSDRIYTMKRGMITSELTNEEINQENIFKKIL